MLPSITERGPAEGPNDLRSTRARWRRPTTGVLHALDRGEHLRFPLAALVLVSIIGAFGVIGHRPISRSVSTEALIAVVGAAAAVVSIVVGCVSLMRWRLVGDRGARDLGTVFVLMGPLWFVPLCVWPTLSPATELTGVITLGAGLVVAAAILALRPLLPRPPARWLTVGAPIVAAAFGIGVAALVERNGVVTEGGVATFARPPSLFIVIAIGAITLVAVPRRAWMLAWAGLAALGICAGELYTARAMGPDDSWVLGRPVLGACAVTLALIGAGMGLRDAYLDVRSQRDRARHDLRATGEQFVAELHRRRTTRHDARSSLMAIHGAIELIERELERHRADTSVIAATRLEVERLRALVDSGAPELPRVAAVVDVVGPVLALHCRSHAAHMDVDPELMLVASPTAVALAVQNLLDNAERHAPHSRIEIAATRQGDSIEIAVMDRGPGVASHRQEKIFDWGVTSAPNGEGIGLHIARALAVDQGGSLRFEPRDGGGACFVLTLPAVTVTNCPDDQTWMITPG